MLSGRMDGWIYINTKLCANVAGYIYGLRAAMKIYIPNQMSTRSLRSKKVKCNNRFPILQFYFGVDKFTI